MFNEQNIHKAQWEKSKLAVHSVRGCQSPVLQLRKPVIQQGAVGRHNRTGCTETEGVMEGARVLGGGQHRELKNKIKVEREKRDSGTRLLKKNVIGNFVFRMWKLW